MPNDHLGACLSVPHEIPIVDIEWVFGGRGRRCDIGTVEPRVSYAAVASAEVTHHPMAADWRTLLTASVESENKVEAELEAKQA